jgi:chromosome segregation ATPase
MAPNALIDSHEDRLQRMEGIVGETRADVAGLVAEVAHVGAAVEKQGQELAKQMREGFASLQSSVRDLERSQQQVRQEAERALARIKKLEDEEKARLRKQSRINKVVVGLGIAGLTTLITKAAAWLWAALGKS